jgi:HD-GYP domain-containing protein (c-di-GMP phosphodiesterase class II)/ribonuclease BN (tRNA processing enzyme)
MIKILGASGSLDRHQECISFLVADNIVIDAGNIMRPLGEKSNAIEHVFLTHAHFDHILDLPFLIETHFEKRTKPLKIYGLKQTIKIIEQSLFNGTIWPKFQEIIHPTLHKPLLSFVELTFEQTLHIDGLSITPIEANHTVETCGFLLKENAVGCLISGDTYLNPKLAERINQDSSIKSLLIDVSFPSSQDELAKQTKHLTPRLLTELVSDFNRSITLYPYHLKPAYKEDILAELRQLSLPGQQLDQVLSSGDTLDVFASKIKRSHIEFYPQNISEENLQSLLNIAYALSAETNLDMLLEMILKQAINFSHADAGTLYRVSEDQKELTFTVIQNQSLNLKMGGTAEPISWNNLPLYQEDGSPNECMVAALCALNKKPILIEDVYADKDFNFEGTKTFDAATGYRSTSMLVIPLLGQHQTLIGVLQLINKQDSSGHIIPFGARDLKYTQALASQAAISLTKTLLIADLEKLFEAVISTITKAFDEKCSYTGGHVRQVSELTQLIAQGIHKDVTTYSEINYTPEHFHTMKLAALLHDVGKIATPEFIMQKSSKLETVQDRIKNIEQRIEILKRDNKIEFLEAQLHASSASHLTDHEKRYQQTEQDLNAILPFLKVVNSGNHYLSDPEIAKINDFATLTFKVNDKSQSLLSEDEVLNLSIRTGTLNQMEREKINDHARVSLEILQTLPFPKKYERVVEIAVNHHEKLDGSGYPRGLTDEHISLEARILILADLYEALSSKDRPYKDPNPLSAIVKTLCSMANQGLIDKKLLRFFFESGLYKAFNKNLQPSQIDEFQLCIE